MESAAFDYDLPDEAIAQTPASPRDSSRLLVTGDDVAHLRTRDFPTLLQPGDVVVLNDTRVLPARMHLAKPTGGQVEVLALEPAGDGRWEALVRPSRRVPDGTVLQSADGAGVLQVDEATGEGTRLVRPLGRAMEQTLATLGSVPLPPYITTELADDERYQTVYAHNRTTNTTPV
ncbi:MAG: S-adenosylmethionine:tRNA ribosyltransferase-isomerase [Actinomycetota bacterium]